MTSEGASEAKEADGVLVAGHICIDIIPNLPAVGAGGLGAILTPGKTTHAGRARLELGGAVPNVALVLHRLGVEATLAGKVGGDALGQHVVELLSRLASADSCHVAVDASQSTSYSIVFNVPGYDRSFLHHNGANDAFTLVDLASLDLEQFRLCHLGYPPSMRSLYVEGGAALVTWLRAMKAHGVTTSVDLALPDPDSPAGAADWRGILEAALPRVDLFLPSWDELLYMLRRDWFEQRRREVSADGLAGLVRTERLEAIAAECLDMGAKIVCIKLGREGLYLRCAGKEALADLGRVKPGDPDLWDRAERRAASFDVPVRGAVGAGDAAIAGFLAAFLRGLPPARVLQAAAGAGAASVENGHDVGAIPTWEALMARIDTAWPLQPLTVDAPGWKIDRQCGQWVKGASQ